MEAVYLSQGVSLAWRRMAPVTLEKVGRVAKITLNVPEKLNAMSLEIADEFGRIVSELCEDPSDYGAVVITGAGSAFSAGGDLGWLRRRHGDTPSRNAEIMVEFYGRFLCVRRLPLPVVAAINGTAIGAGLCFAMGCDIRVVSAKAKLGFTFVGLGIHPGMGATHLVASVAGYEVAYRLLLTGEVVDGTEAHRLRLATEIAADGPAAVSKAMAIANKLAAQGPLAVRATVRTLRQRQDEGLASALRREADSQSQQYGSADFAEGLSALAEKRAPVFGQFENYRDTAEAASAGGRSKL